MTASARAGAPSRADGGTSSGILSGESGAWRIATLFVVPYVLLAMAWLGSNPPVGAPDEDAHLVKALGIARLDIGVPYAGPVDLTRPAAARNDSNTRVVTIPSRLSPQSYGCFGFRPEVTADCQPPPPADRGDIQVGTNVGAYPPFLYLPVGLAASAASTPPQAIMLGRAVILVETALLLWLAVWHLVRWLGRRALLGVVIAASPMAVFCTSILNTSGLEIFGALGVAAVVAVFLRRPESLSSRATQAVMLVSGSALILGRQLGLVTMAALVLLMLALGAGPPLWAEVRRGSRMMTMTVALLGVETLAVVAWELAYDHPALLGPWASRSSLRSFAGRWFQTATDGVGSFGWLDVVMASWTTTLWLVAAAALLLGGLVRGRRRDRLVIVGMFLALALLAYVTYSRVFEPAQSGLQGRHLMPFFALLAVFAGIVVAERMSPATFGRLLTGLALVLPPLQFYALFLNAKRYAVGLTSEPTWFLPAARWSPPPGWLPWLVLGFVACLGMLLGWVHLARTSPRIPGPAPTPASMPAVDAAAVVGSP